MQAVGRRPRRSSAPSPCRMKNCRPRVVPVVFAVFAVVVVVVDVVAVDVAVVDVAVVDVAVVDVAVVDVVVAVVVVAVVAVVVEQSDSFDLAFPSSVDSVFVPFASSLFHTVVFVLAALLRSSFVIRRSAAAVVVVLVGDFGDPLRLNCRFALTRTQGEKNHQSSRHQLPNNQNHHHPHPHIHVAGRLTAMGRSSPPPASSTLL